jgi:hypothetical protein
MHDSDPAVRPEPQRGTALMKKRYLAYFAKLAELLTCGEPPDPFSDRELLNFNECAFGGFPWSHSKVSP